jgi:hypothetical protein
MDHETPTSPHTTADYEAPSFEELPVTGGLAETAPGTVWPGLSR